MQNSDDGAHGDAMSSDPPPVIFKPENFEYGLDRLVFPVARQDTVPSFSESC